MGPDMLVVFIGPPGAGKGTQSANLVSYLEIVHLSTGELLRASIDAGTRLGGIARAYINRGQLVPDAIMVDLIATRLSNPDCQPGCLLDGFPRTLPQARALDQMLAEQDRQLDVVLALHVPRDELERRLISRSGEEGRADDSPETIIHRLEIYERQTAPLIEYYRRRSKLSDIDGIGTMEEVFDRIKQAVDAAR